MASTTTEPVVRSIVLEPELSEVGRARGFVKEIASEAGFTEERVFDMTVASSEAAANAIEHVPEKGHVIVRTLLYPDRLEVQIEGPGEFRPPRNVAERSCRGMGLPLMASLSDHLALFSGPQGGTLVTLTFRRPGVAGDPTPGALPPAVRELIEENELFSAITDNAPVGLYVLDSGLRYRWANSAYQGFLEEPYRSIDLTGLLVRDVVPGASDSGIIEDLREVSMTGHPILNQESEVTGYQRGATWWRRHVLPLVSESKEPPFDLLVVLTDETDRKRNETALGWSARRQELLTNTAARLLESHDPQSIVEDLCREVMDFLDCHVFFNFLADEPTGRLRLNAYAGISAEAAKEIDWLDYGVAVCGCAARDRERLVAEHISTAEDPRTTLVKSYGVQAYCCHPLLVRGRLLGTLSFGTRSRPEFGSDEIEVMASVAGLVAIAMNRISMEEELIQSRSDLDRAQTVGQIGSWRLDLQRNVLTWSDENHRIFGVPKGTVMSLESFLDSVHPDDRAYVEERWTAGVNGEPYDIEHRIVVGDEVKWVREKAYLEFDQGGGVLGGFGITQDITPRKRAEEERNQLLQQIMTERAQLEAILSSMDEAVEIWSPSGEPLDVNEATVRMNGFSSREEMLERMAGLPNVEVLTVQGRSLPPEEWPAARVIRGEAFSDWQLEVRVPETGMRFIGSHSGAPVRDEKGNMLVGVVTVHDVTDLHEASEGLKRELDTTRLLLEASASLNSQTDLAALLDTLASTLLQATKHSRVTILVYDEAPHEWRVGASAGKAPVPLSVVPDAILSAGFRQVIAAGQTLLNDFDSSPEPDRGVAEKYGSHLALQVPLLFRGRAIGVIGVDDPGERRSFSEREVAIVEGIASQAASAIENARLHAAQRSIAEALQEALVILPSKLPGLEISHLYRSATEAARLGGDFYDVFEVKNGVAVLLIGDVSGHGIQAARTATLVRDVIHAYTHQSLRPQEVLARTNQLLVEKRLQGFVTVFLGVLDTKSGLLTFSSAGHPETILRRAKGDLELLGRGSSPLGVYPQRTWNMGETMLETGDLLVLYTDGIIEARRDGDFFGEHRLHELLERDDVSVEELPSFIMDEVLAFSGGALRDDAAVLALSLAGGRTHGPDKTATRQGTLLP